MSNTGPSTDDHIAEEAAAWFTLMREGEPTAAQNSEFAHWLAKSPVHVTEYLGVAQAWKAVLGADGLERLSRHELLAGLRAATPDNVTTLHRSLSPSIARTGSSAVTRKRLHSAVAAAAALLVLTTIWFVLNPDRNEYRTARGEQRSVVLADGSVVQLNTLTKMVVHFDAGFRRIELPEGEAFFRVARDASRPFEVETPFARVRAVGTEFNVYNQKESTRVDVVEGRVQIASFKSPAESLALGPREAADVSVKGQMLSRVPASGDASGGGATAWIQRRIVLDDTPLQVAVDEFNRYNRLQMQVNDASLASLRISGVFSADDPHALMSYLKMTQDVEIVMQEHGGLSLEKK